MTEQQIDLDLDALAGGEVWVQLDGRPERFFADFSSADEAHYLLIQSRRQRDWLRGEQLRAVAARHQAALAQAAQTGEPPPVLPAAELAAYGESHADWYGMPEYETALFGLLTRVWQASENGKPAAERVTVDEDRVRRRVNTRQAQALLDRLWPSRFGPRVSAPAPAAAPAVPADQDEPAAPKPKRRGRAGS